MKKNRWLTVALILVALWLIFGSRSGAKKETAEPKKTEQTEQAEAASDVFVVPEGAVYIALPKDPDHDDFLAFDREFAAALAARETVICTRGRSPLSWPGFCEMDYGTFWLKSFGYSTAWAVPEGETDKTFFYTYHMEYFDLSESDIRRMKQEIDASVSRIFALFPENADSWTKALIVHDELVKTVSYDHENDSVYYFNPYGALVQHEAICQGYAAAFTFLMSRAGEYCTYSASEDHGWNNMLTSSEEEYVDCTWDDPDLSDAYGNPYVSHDFFFLNREEVEAVDSHTIVTGDPYVSFPGEERHANYFYHEGYILSDYDARALTEIYRRQLQAGGNLLEARFETEEAYREALALTENECAGLNRVLANAGYYNPYYYFTNDDVRTLSVGLDPPGV